MMAAAAGHDQRRGGVREVRAGVDLNAVTGYAPAPGAGWRDGDAFLGGGTWLFSEPQPGTTRCSTSPLRLAAAHRDRRRPGDRGDLHARRAGPLAARARPAARGAAALPRQCADALLGSFKVQNVATVGGNICLSLPAGPMISLAAALDGVAAIAPADGTRPHGRPSRTWSPASGANVLAPASCCAAGLPPGRARCRADRVPPGLAVGRRPLRRPPHRPPLPGEHGGASQTVLTVTAADRRARSSSASPAFPAPGRRPRRARRGRTAATWTTCTAARPWRARHDPPRVAEVIAELAANPEAAPR